MRLDLHGIKHKDVQNLVTDNIFAYPTPIYIITGNSSEMQRLVIEVLDKYECKYYIPTNNLGQIIVTENV